MMSVPIRYRAIASCEPALYFRDFFPHYYEMICSAFAQPHLILDTIGGRNCRAEIEGGKSLMPYLRPKNFTSRAVQYSVIFTSHIA